MAGSLVDGWTYQQVLQACVDFFAWSQNPDGGWRYVLGDRPSDNSNTGYAVLGLRYAEAPVYGFSCSIPAAVKAGLDNWIAAIQDPVNGDADDGGSWYTADWSWVNQLKTGNLLFEMSFVGDTVGVQRVQDALDYIERHWNDNNMDPGWRPHAEQTMYCLMKGLASVDVDTLTVEGNPVDWYTEFAQALVDSQQPGGYWMGEDWGDDLLCTAWALLVLEKVAPPPPVDVKVVLPDCACDGTGYTVSFPYSVERFVVDGTLSLSKDAALYETVVIEDFTGNGEYSITLAADTPGTHTWEAVLEVAPVGGGTPGRAQDADSVAVCETPQVGDIPDQTAPFASFDLDDYLAYGGDLPVAWTGSGIPSDWTVTIDGNNVVTVVAPEGASDPVTISFAAFIHCCDQVTCLDSDLAVFTPNQPPDCSGAYPSLERLWPPNNQFVAVQILGVTDPDGDAVTITITAIRQDEPVDTYGDGRFAPDGSGVGSSTAQLRAERSGTKKVPGNGRAYYLYFTADDGRGMSCSGVVLVEVPHDVKDPVIADGPNYDSTVIP